MSAWISHFPPPRDFSHFEAISDLRDFRTLFRKVKEKQQHFTSSHFGQQTLVGLKAQDQTLKVHKHVET